jgi:CheY-like chemotaxis protein
MECKAKKILIVEDDPVTQECVRLLLEAQLPNVKVFTLGNGLAGYEVSKLLKPDLIVTDCDMPEMNGLEMTAKIRKDSAVPIVMLSGNDGAQEAFLSLARGNAFHLKPAGSRFLQDVGRLLNLSLGGPHKLAA